MSESKKSELKFTSPAVYRICVKGFLDESWSDRLSGMAIDNRIAGKTSPFVALSGKVSDQTELIGLLNNLYEMHLSLLSVECMEQEGH